MDKALNESQKFLFKITEEYTGPLDSLEEAKALRDRLAFSNLIRDGFLSVRTGEQESEM